MMIASLLKSDAGTFTAQIVVGADGSNGITRRCILPNESIHTARVLEVITPEQNVIASKAKQSLIKQEIITHGNDIHESDVAYFDFFAVPFGIAGYTWDFPTQINGEPMRCWGIYDTNVLSYKERPALKEPLAEEMSRHGFDLSQCELKGHPIRWFSPFNQFAVQRIILVGDAAGADGIFGEGISIALGYGIVASKAIRDAIDKNDFSFRDYRRRILLKPARTSIDHPYRHHAYSLSFALGLVPEIFLARLQAGSCCHLIPICIELGKTNEMIAFYVLILFKNPGVFNSRSSR